MLLEVDDKEKFIMRFEENKSCAEVLDILNEKTEDETVQPRVNYEHFFGMVVQ